jgi:cephalosporin hydroxylase
MINITSDKTIEQILNEYDINSPYKFGGTDKCDQHSYGEMYENILSSYMDKEGSLLEIGIKHGGSILLWSEFLKKFKIYGVDITYLVDTNISDYIENNKERIHLEIFDAYLEENISKIKNNCPNGYDIIIDDGPHTEESQIKCIELYLNLLKEDGVLVIEDIQNINTVQKLQDCIPLSDLFDYETQVLDLRENKERYDDIVFIIKKTAKNKKEKLAIFYHLYQINDWIKLYQEQINSLVVSGLYDKCEFVHIGINGDKELPFVLDKIKIQYNTDNKSEVNTLQSLWEFCKENLDYKVLYFHSKGVTHFNNFHCEFTTNAWRIYLEYFVIHHWKQCVIDLQEYDCVGTEWEDIAGFTDPDDGKYYEEILPHYAGNFWWANANYIDNLDLNYILNIQSTKNLNKYKCEFWLGSKKPNYKSYHNSNKLLYNFNYSPNYYINTDKKMTETNFDLSSKIFIVTPCRRPFNLQTISKTIPKECEWIVVFDSEVKNNHEIENAKIIKSPYNASRGYLNKNFGVEYIKDNLNPNDNDWVLFLHDDNIIHPKWLNSVDSYINSEYSMIIWGQCTSDEIPRIQTPEVPKTGNIDTSQYMVRWNIAKNLRFENVYEADGIYAEEAAKQGPVKKLDQYLGYYNFLRAHKTGQEIRTNICMISMFKNEAKGIRRMLESVWRHIDFYVFQDNGSTDGTPEIVKEFFADKNIPGFIYEVEEGWVGFGWNRDHLLQTTLRNDHGCDWIMKMDCDEYLEVDEDFDWSYFYNTNIESFHVAAVNPGCIYYRAWIWNAKLPWKFKHDVAHECIYLDNEKGENFQVTDLPRSLRMCGTNDGESYTVRTKYITDALKLEEKLIREETMLTDMYHFWYTGKSYMDCFRGDFYPLGEHHSREFARRAIFYFTQYIDVVHERGNLQRGINEMCYYATFCIGECYKFLGDIEKAIYYFKDAESFCSVRNEHLVHLAHTYNELEKYDKMLEVTTRLVDPERKLPFPHYYFLIDTNLYYDSGPVPQHLHNHALSKVNQTDQMSINSFSIHTTTKPRLWIVDDFYADPHAVREFALKQEFEPNLDYYKGSRTKEQFIVPGTKEAFEKIIGKKITNWTETHGMCGRFQYCTAEDALVYHCDGQTLAGMIYLTPDAPFSCGTSLYAHKDTKLRNENDFGNTNVFEGGFYDKSKFELVDTAGNVFNRLVLFDAKCIHSANEYFGTNITNSRLFHLFFFD